MEGRIGFYKAIYKKLSANDVGRTGAHQAGMCIPKEEEVLSFFPELNKKEKNPRTILYFTDDNNQRREFHYIYYNNRYFGGTRDEYRLTMMTQYIRENNLIPGDKLILGKNEKGDFFVTYQKAADQPVKYLKLSNKWKIFNY